MGRHFDSRLECYVRSNFKHAENRRKEAWHCNDRECKAHLVLGIIPKGPRAWVVVFPNDHHGAIFTAPDLLNFDLRQIRKRDGNSFNDPIPLSLTLACQTRKKAGTQKVISLATHRLFPFTAVPKQSCSYLGMSNAATWSVSAFAQDVSASNPPVALGRTPSYSSRPQTFA